MRFFRRSFPANPRILLVESGSRHLMESVLPHLLRYFGEGVPFGLVTCFAGRPSGLGPEIALYNTNHYRDRQARRRLLRSLREEGYNVMVMLCSGEPILSKWKWALALRLPVRLLVVNENSDFFWFDRDNLSIIRRLVLDRAGLSGGGAVGTLLQALFFPLTLAFLLAYAVFIHLRRILYGRKVHV